MTAARRLILALAIGYGSWLGMMAVHELGHIAHALLSGGRVAAVSLPLLGFSQTIVWPNPREHFVAWGGALWGTALPLLACAAVHLFARGPRPSPPHRPSDPLPRPSDARPRVPALLRFFAGFCLIANGVYLGLGWTRHAGDAGDLLRLGTPVWVMVAFGVACFTGGLAVWHTLGRVSDFFLPARPRDASGPPSGRG